MAIKLKYLGTDKIEFRMTKKPISNRQASPAPTGKKISDLDQNDPNYKIEREKILSHPNYSESELVVLKPGINVFENEEHAEYLYEQLGNPEVGGYMTYTDGTQDKVVNKNILIEVDEKGNEVKDNLFKKYRQPLRMAHIKN